ncbi:hypothetical protein ACFE04_008510 [Oxalis oulophora]
MGVGFSKLTRTVSPRINVEPSSKQLRSSIAPVENIVEPKDQLPVAPAVNVEPSANPNFTENLEDEVSQSGPIKEEQMNQKKLRRYWEEASMEQVKVTSKRLCLSQEEASTGTDSAYDETDSLTENYVDPFDQNYGDLSMFAVESMYQSAKESDWTEVRDLTEHFNSREELYLSLKNRLRVQTQQNVVLRVTKLYCVSKASPSLKNSTIDMNTPANRGITRIKNQFSEMFIHSLVVDENFVKIKTPKLIAGASERGSAMAICGNAYRVYETGPINKAGHFTEFTGLYAEMEIKKYSELMDLVDRLFVKTFDTLKEACREELEAVAKQFPFTSLKYLQKTKRLTFEDGVQMLKDAGVDVDPLGALNTEAERKLGRLVLEKYDTEFYILDRFPLAIRQFNTMPCHDDLQYCNSFDVFLRGEKITVGAQHINNPQFLTERAYACGIDVTSRSISTYIDGIRCGAPRHGGFVAVFEHVVMLFLGFHENRVRTLFPCDWHRLKQ